MPKFLEDKLKQEYGENSDIPYKIMNKKGYMRGPNETKKGVALEKKHEQDLHSGKAELSRKRKKK